MLILPTFNQFVQTVPIVKWQCREICNVGSFSVRFQNLVKTTICQNLVNHHLSNIKEVPLQSATRDSCKGFFVDQQQLLKQAEPGTSPLCPERCIIVIMPGWLDRCHPCFIVPLSLQPPSRDVWKGFLQFSPIIHLVAAHITIVDSTQI